MQIMVSSALLNRNLNTYSSQRIFWFLLVVISLIITVWQGIIILKKKRCHYWKLPLIGLFFGFILFLFSLNGLMPTNQSIQETMLRNNQRLPRERFKANRNYRIFHKFGEWVPVAKQPQEKHSGREYYENSHAIVRQTKYNQIHKKDVYVEWPDRLISKL